MSISRDTEFGEYVAARWTRLVRAAVLLGCSPHEAEDVTQTALTRCLVKWSKVQRADDRDAYVHRILVNTFTDSRRRRWNAEKPTGELPEPVGGRDATDEVHDRDVVDRALANLTDEQRTAVVLRYYLNQSEAQMAGTLRVAPGTVKSRLARALKAMAVDPVLSDEPSAPTNERGLR
ncbi:SigE family RNA polymerase sigma factor [soil metagenome]